MPGTLLSSPDATINAYTSLSNKDLKMGLGNLIISPHVCSLWTRKIRVTVN
jgi:hypothetical protein